MSTSQQTATLFSLAFWRAYTTTLRPYLLFLSLAAGLVGLAIGEPTVLWPVYALAFFFSYGLGQAITDTFQIDTDALSSPYRPLVQGEISRRHVLFVSLLGLSFFGIIFFLSNPSTVVPVIAAVVGLVTYTWFKRRWWGGPPWNGWIVATLPLTGVLCSGPSLADALSQPNVILAMLSAYASYVPFVILGYFKDVSADSATGYETLVVKFGSLPAVIISLAHAIVGLIASTALIWHIFPSQGNLSAFVLWLFGWILMFYAHLVLWVDSNEVTAYRGIVPVASAFVAIHLAEAALLRPAFLGFAILAYLISVWIVWNRPMKEQI